ncbi:hypothetical protein BLNAU_16199 [Blattamonas nauphoetae]|uniref:Uncharacterized protein n=1 Tax=Blattamonas nauphoetae TaxID=2049346 RepID=A0ABQ9XAA4_9EUKA|nr:hypothetical protein BLNAU_16199 [Blattamonas nauphoetae]
MSSRQKKAKTRNHPLSSPSSPPTTTRSFQTFCTNPSAASSRFIAMLLCNIVSLAAQRSSACDKTKQSQSNLSFLPATLPRKERHSIAESMLALRLNMFSKEKWKPHKFLQLIQRILFDLLDSEMHKLGFSSISLSPLRQSIRLNMSVVAAVNTGLRSISEISEGREDPRAIARQDTQLDRKDTDQESQNCPVSGRLCASELDSLCCILFVLSFLFSPFSFQLICGSAHQVTLESTNVSSASLSSVALISTSCSVSMSNCRFSSIVVLESHGSVLRADASNTARVSVLNTVLSDCSSSGVGSAILLSKLNGGSFSSTDWDGMFNLSNTMGEVLVFDASLPASKSNPSSLLYEFHPHVAGNPIECRLDSGTTRIVDWRNSPVRHWLMRCRPLLLWLRCVVQNGLINP